MVLATALVICLAIIALCIADEVCAATAPAITYERYMDWD